MKYSVIILIIIAVAAFTSHYKNTESLEHTVNPVIGNLSYIESFGVAPDETTNENLRVQTHLKYAEQFLRSKPVSKLTKEQKQNRFKILDLLKDYWTTGIFPKNYDHLEKRKPCFIDKDGRICAVGYLVEQTAGRQIAEDINVQYQYAYLSEMDNPDIDNWINSTGLTKEEYAIIQPSYPPEPPKPLYSISSSVLGGLNLSMNTINGIQIANGVNNRKAPIIGLLSGATQVAIGALGYNKKHFTLSEVHESQRNLSLINIGLGTSSIILSSWNLLINRQPKKKSISLNIYSFPTQQSELGLGFSLTKNL